MHSSPPQDRANILVVDDTPGNIQLLAEALKDDYEVFFATSGEEAIEMASGKRIDLMLLDIMMPEVDGYEVCRLMQLDETLREIPVIFVTAKSEIADEAKGFDVGAVDYITKPISPLIVQARVRTHLELKASRDRLRALASLDGLTGIPNCPYFDDMLAREIQRARLDGRPLAVLLLGVDHFKHYNQSEGHLAGDRALRLIASALLPPPERPLDLAARFQDDQFALTCPDTDADTAAALSRHLLARVAELRIARGASLTHLTASIGGVILEPQPEASAPPTAAAATARARALLAKAKRNGHNQFWLERLGGEA